MQKPTVEIVTAGKKLIAELRAMDTHNRKRKKSHVDYLRSEIREGRWVLTNQGVGVNVSGQIVDGGHRLEAIDLEGCPPVHFILARGLPDVAQKYVDQGARRNMSDVLTLFFDTSISTQVVATLNVLILSEKGRNSVKPSPDVLIEKLEEMGESLKRVAGVEKSSRLAAPVFAALVKTFHETENDKVLRFAEQIITGEMLQTGDPALTLRNWLINSKGAGSGGTGPCMERYLKTLNAVGAALEGRRITKVYASKTDQ